MNFKNIIALAKFEMKINLANPMAIFINIVMYPLIFSNSISDLKNEALRGLLAMFILMQVLISTIMFVPIKETTNRDTKVIKRLIATPVTKFDYLLSGILTQYLLTLIPIGIMLVMCSKVLTYVIVFKLILIFTIAFICAYLFGFIISQFVNDAQSAKAIGMICFILLIYAANADNQLSANLLKILPINQLSDLFKVVLYQVNGHVFKDIVIILMYSLVFLVVSVKRFIWE